MLLLILFKEKKQRGHEPEQILDLEPFCFPHSPLMKFMQLRYSMECVYFQKLKRAVNGITSSQKCTLI